MVIGHGVSSFALRQMEFDADRYEARVAGSDVFVKTSERLELSNMQRYVLSERGDEDASVGRAGGEAFGDQHAESLADGGPGDSEAVGQPHGEVHPHR